MVMNLRRTKISQCVWWLLLVGCAFGCLLTCDLAFADSVENTEKTHSDDAGAVSSPKKSDGTHDELTVTHHQASIGGQPISYTATAGTLVVRPMSLDDRNRWMRKLSVYVGSKATF